MGIFPHPPYNRLRTTLLAQEKARLRKLLQPTRDRWVKKGLSLCSDSWSDGVNRPIINVMAAYGTSTIFVDSIDASGKRKDVAFVAEVFIQAIKEVGPENVVQVITDNGANFTAAGGDKFDVDVDVCDIADLSINKPDLRRALLDVEVGEEDED
ncbi:hypothetical protein BVRB_003630 [Beta vulgaris subsp. vulgaris]|uniref:DUF659 domain-containing protein n=2 Tax=Beta vulgaris subsp. vulgaris TaxID=3555 RepID=A0A0J8B806_BETVV|nr:hypothetical protein BVRB_003630 [Beta vulgaris subsp. vulgaris]